MAVLGDHRVAELLVKAEIAGKLAPDTDSDLPVALRAGVLQGPRHQCRPDALALAGGIHGDSPHVKAAVYLIAANGYTYAVSLSDSTTNAQPVSTNTLTAFESLKIN